MHSKITWRSLDKCRLLIREGLQFSLACTVADTQRSHPQLGSSMEQLMSTGQYQNTLRARGVGEQFCKPCSRLTPFATLRQGSLPFKGLKTSAQPALSQERQSLSGQTGRISRSIWKQPIATCSERAQLKKKVCFCCETHVEGVPCSYTPYKLQVLVQGLRFEPFSVYKACSLAYLGPETPAFNPSTHRQCPWSQCYPSIMRDLYEWEFAGSEPWVTKAPHVLACLSVTLFSSVNSWTQVEQVWHQCLHYKLMVVFTNGLVKTEQVMIAMQADAISLAKN